MSSSANFLAFDLGAESGRAMLGRLADGRLDLSEVHRFANGPVPVPDKAGHVSLHWDVLHLWNEIQQGIALRGREGPLAGIGLDTWGVDFALLDRHGALIGNPTTTATTAPTACSKRRSAACRARRSSSKPASNSCSSTRSISSCRCVLQRRQSWRRPRPSFPCPILFNYWLPAGRPASSASPPRPSATTHAQNDWASPLLERWASRTRIFPEIVPAGTAARSASPAVAEELARRSRADHRARLSRHRLGGGGRARRGGGHRGDFAWISSGTWSMMGAEVAEADYHAGEPGATISPTRAARAAPSASAKTSWACGWCRSAGAIWATQGEEWYYTECTQMAAGARPFVCVIDPDDGDFLKPGDMPARIRAFAAAPASPFPKPRGVRALHPGRHRAQVSLLLERLEEMLGQRLEPIHIVGGGAQSRLLSRFTADATGRPVITGPVEATAMGNILMQAVALGHLGSLREARALVRDSFEMVTFEPGKQSGWDEAYARLKELPSS